MTPREWSRLSSLRVFVQGSLDSSLKAHLGALACHRYSESELLELSLHCPLATREVMGSQRPEFRMLVSVGCANDGLRVVELAVVSEEILSTFTKSVFLKKRLTSELVRLSNRRQDCIRVSDVGQAHFNLPNSRRSRARR